jgi:hypothetical protein
VPVSAFSASQRRAEIERHLDDTHYGMGLLRMHYAQAHPGHRPGA